MRSVSYYPAPPGVATDGAPRIAERDGEAYTTDCIRLRTAEPSGGGSLRPAAIW